MPRIHLNRLAHETENTEKKNRTLGNKLAGRSPIKDFWTLEKMEETSIVNGGSGWENVGREEDEARVDAGAEDGSDGMGR